MTNWGISSIKMFKEAIQNIIDLVESENGAWKFSNPAKFECKIFNIPISIPANTVNMLVILLFSVNHNKNSFLAFSLNIIRNADTIFNPIGTV
jgi:hypothetical protein